MDVFNRASVFAEDLMKYFTGCLNIKWEPLSTTYKYRGRFPTEFKQAIGDVVVSMYNYRLNKVPQKFFPISMDEANAYLLEEFFKFGNDFFGLLNYCAQLALYAMVFVKCGHTTSFDYCAVYIASTISSFISMGEEQGKSERTYWYELRKTACMMNTLTGSSRDLRPSVPVARMSNDFRVHYVSTIQTATKMEKRLV